MQHNIKGMSLMASIFIIVLLALASSFTVSMGAHQARSTDFELMRAKAFMASRSGLEIAVYALALDPSTCPTQTINFGSGDGGLNGYSATITCSSLTTHVHDTQNISLVTVSSVGSWGSFGDYDFVSKSLEVTISL